MTPKPPEAIKSLFTPNVLCITNYTAPALHVLTYFANFTRWTIKEDLLTHVAPFRCHLADFKTQVSVSEW